MNLERITSPLHPLYKQALELYQIDDRNEYTIELKGKMEKLGIN